MGGLAGHVQHQPAAVRLFALEPRACIPGFQSAPARGKEFHIADMHVGWCPRSELQVDEFAETPVRGEGARTVRARVKACRQGKIHQHDLGPGAPIGGRTQLQNLRREPPRLRFRALAAVRQPAGIPAAVQGRNQQHHFRLELVERAVIVHDFRNVVVVISNQELRGEGTGPGNGAQKMPQQLVERGHGAPAEERHPNWLLPGNESLCGRPAAEGREQQDVFHAVRRRCLFSQRRKKLRRLAQRKLLQAVQGRNGYRLGNTGLRHGKTQLLGL